MLCRVVLAVALLVPLASTAQCVSAGVPRLWVATPVCTYREEAYGFALGHGVVIWNEVQGPQTQNLRGFIWQHGKTVALRDQTGSGASDVNERGQVVGYGGPVGAFVWRDGKWTATAGLSYPTAVNEQGQVLGHSGDGGQLWQHGRVTSLGHLSPTAINDRGSVVGTISGHAYVWENGKQSAAAIPGWKSFTPAAITDRGQIYGSVAAHPYDAPQAWVLWQAGRVTRLDLLGGRSSTPVAVSRTGQVIGSYRTSTWGTRGFLWEDGRMRDLGTLGGHRSEAVAVNAHAAVVGRSETSNGAWHGFLWQAGKMTDLSTVRPLAIDDDGEILAVDGSRIILLSRTAGP